MIRRTLAQTVHRKAKVRFDENDANKLIHSYLGKCFHILLEFDLNLNLTKSNVFIGFSLEVIRSEGKRRRFPRTVEQCEREIQRLKTSLDAIRSHRGDGNGSDMGRDSNDDANGHSDIKMRNIITKYVKL